MKQYIVKMVDDQMHPAVTCTVNANNEYDAIVQAEERYPFYIAVVGNRNETVNTGNSNCSADNVLSDLRLG